MKRNDSIILKKFLQLMLPAFGTAVAVSLNEFVDSIMVSQLLSSRSMAIINIGSPIMFLASCIYMLFGTGGSIVYARLLGEKKEKDAEKIFGLSLMLSVIIGIIFMVIGLIFISPIANFLAGKSDILNDLYPYLIVLFISVPFIILVMTIASFLPVMNHPVLGSSFAIIANVVNLIMDYIYIKFCGMTVYGAALATLTGYLVTMALVVFLFAKKLLPSPSFKKLRTLKISSVLEITKTGMSDALIQFGFAVTGGFCNSLASGYGNNGLIAFSFFMQLGSIISIFLAGICNGATPIYALLYGADDMHGIKMLTKKAVIILEISSVLLIALFLLFPGALFWAFDIQEGEQTILCMRSIIAFAIYAPIRSLVVLYRMLLNASEKEQYATLISVMDGIAGTLVFSWLGTKLFGIDGLWYAYIINMFVIIIFIIANNSFLYFKNKKRISMLYLMPNDARGLLFETTITSNSQEITKLSETVTKCCKEKGYDDKISMFAGLLTEEMSVYTRNQCGENQYIDILVRKNKNNIKIDFRSIGMPFNPLAKNEKDADYNTELIQKLASDIIYIYGMGLNTTTLILKSK